MIDGRQARPSPDVSVVIVNWNTRDLLQQTLTTLYARTEGVTFETIVVDNGSIDGSAELVQNEWASVHLIKSPINIGFSAGNNLGFTMCQGRYILLLNSDTIVLSSTLPGLVHFLDTHADAGCVGARHLNLDGSLQRSVDNSPGLLNDFFEFTELHRVPQVATLLRRHFPWWGEHDRIREVGWVNGACMLVRREILADVGGLDEGYFIYAEEVDWCYRMRKAGWRVYFTPASEIIHIGGQAMNRVPDQRVVLRYKSQYRFYRKHHPMWKSLVLRSIVSLSAIARIAALAALHIVNPQGRSSLPRHWWHVLTQEPVVTRPIILLRAWWRILWLPW